MTRFDPELHIRAVPACDTMSRRLAGLGAAASAAPAAAGWDPPPALLFDRLQDRYLKRFGALPPVSGLDVEAANRLMRRALAAPDADGPRAGAARPTH